MCSPPRSRTRAAGGRFPIFVLIFVPIFVERIFVPIFVLIFVESRRDESSNRRRSGQGSGRRWQSTKIETKIETKIRDILDRRPTPSGGSYCGTRCYNDGSLQGRAELTDRLPIALSMLAIGDLRILHLPGEPMVEFQLFAQRSAPKLFVAVAGYGDAGTGYLCTKESFGQGGYEPSATSISPDGEAVFKSAIRQLLSADQPSR